jgi:hypothetical protein
MAWEFKDKLDAALAKEASGLKQVKPPTGVNFVIKVDFDAKIEKAALADPLLRKDFEDAAQDTIARFVEFVGLQKRLEKHPSGKGGAQLAKVRTQFHAAVDATEEKILDAQKTLLTQVERAKDMAGSFGAAVTSLGIDRVAKQALEGTFLE